MISDQFNNPSGPVLGVRLTSSQVPLSEAGSRPLRPQAMTGRVRREGLGPRSAGRTRPSSNCGVWVRERHRVDSVGEICRAAAWALGFFLNECMQICVSGFSWHLSFSSSTRSGEFPIIIINGCSIRTQSVFSNGSLSHTVCPSLFVPCASSSFKHVKSGCFDNFLVLSNFLRILVLESPSWSLYKENSSIAPPVISFSSRLIQGCVMTLWTVWGVKRDHTDC